ncbi:MAG: hypothetical protein ACRDPF_29755 [Streptosporangiaceae bacterium]
MTMDFFTIASYDVIAMHSFADPAGDFGPIMTRMVRMRSGSDNPLKVGADVFFSAVQHTGPDQAGFVFTSDSGSLDIIAAVPMSEFDVWFDLLKGDRSVRLMYQFDSETGSLTLPVMLTTAEDPNSMIFDSPARLEAMPPALRQLLPSPSEVPAG